ncbi:MAG: CPBP family intramembrane metalloprotease [Clostridia bacterium]|nr:CPBP family intramembrane metalloprotease [Clostridia bacterium]
MTYPETQWALSYQQAAEERHLKKMALFVGLSLIAMPAMQFAASFLLGDWLYKAELAMSRSSLDLLLYYALYIGFYCLMLLVPVGVLAVIFRRPPTLPAEGRAKISLLQGVLLLAFGMAFCLLANYITNYWLQALEGFFGISPFNGGVNNDSGWLSLGLNLFTYAILPALVEELVFRGWMLGALQPFGERRALLLSALIFGLIHGNLTQMPFAFILGLLFGYVFLRTGRLWPCMVLHFLNNGLSVMLDYASANMGLSENTYVLINLTVTAVLVGIGMLAGLLLYLHRAGHPLTRLLTDRRHVTTAARRSRLMWFNPAVIVGLLVLALLTLLTEVAL